MTVNKSPIRYALVALMFCALTLNGFTLMVFSARAVDVMTTYHMSQAQLTSISGVANLGGFFFSILFGWLADRYGVRKFPALVFGLSAAVAILRLGANSYWSLWILTFIASSLFLPAAMLAPKLFSSYFEPREMASVMGVYAAGAGMGTTLAFAIAPLMPSTRAALGLIAAGQVIVFIAWLALVHDPEGSPADRDAPAPNILKVLKSPTMIKVMLCGGLSTGCFILINSYAVTCMLGKGMSASAASLTATLMNLCLLAGSIVSGFIVDRIGKYNLPYLVICAVGGIGYVLTYWFLPAGAPTTACMALFSLISAGSIGVNMGRINLIPLTGEFGPELNGAAGGMNQTAAGLFGWLLPVIVASIFGDNYVGMFSCSAVLFTCLGVFGLCIPELGNKGKLARSGGKAPR